MRTRHEEYVNVMSGTTHSTIPPRQLIRIIRKRYRLWMVPTIVCTLVGVVAALTMPRQWEASQGLIVRQEAGGSHHQRPGSFSNTEEMKRIQETILEIAKSRSVLTRTLVQVGPPPGVRRGGQWPSHEDLDIFGKRIRMTPPGGAEFGLTEVVYLTVRSPNRDRALKLLTELCKQLEARFMEVRDERAQSMINELEKTVALAEEELEEATVQLAEFESTVGADLTELRMLLDSPSGTSDLRQKLISRENSKQEYAAQMQQQQKLLEMLNVAKREPRALIATPNSLLDSQPALRRLKEGLIEAQLRTSQLLGRLSPTHPEVMAAHHAELEVRASLRRELETAIRGVEVDLQISSDRMESLEEEIARGKSQLQRLASLRARYANLVALTKDRTQLLEQARRNLAEAQASKASARATSLIGRIDAPHVGHEPVGPGGIVIAATGVVGGLSIGLALVFLFCLPTHSQAAATLESRPSRGVHDPPAESVQVEAGNPAPPPEEPKSNFGMFHGKTLREAMEEVRRNEGMTE